MGVAAQAVVKAVWVVVEAVMAVEAVSELCISGRKEPCLVLSLMRRGCSLLQTASTRRGSGGQVRHEEWYQWAGETRSVTAVGR